MSVRLSYSAANKYSECGKQYEFHYKHRYRAAAFSGALLFGTAIDDAITALLRDKKDPIEVFERSWMHQDIHGVMTYLPRAVNIVYAESDYDEDLLTPDDIKLISGTLNIKDVKEELNRIYAKKPKKGWQNLLHYEKELLSYANWLCYYRKGVALLQGFQNNILPQIEEVIAVQKQFSFKNNDGDEVIGYIDFIGRIKGHDGVVVLDWKTSTRRYSFEEVSRSFQLALYLFTQSALYDNTRLAGYGVLNKILRKTKTKICTSCGHDGSGERYRTCNNLRPTFSCSHDTEPGEELPGKRCDGAWKETVSYEPEITLLIDRVPQQTENIVIESLDAVNKGIKQEIYHRNFNACVKPYGKCDFYNLCYRNTADGLIKLDK